MLRKGKLQPAWWSVTRCCPIFPIVAQKVAKIVFSSQVMFFKKHLSPRNFKYGLIWSHCLLWSPFVHISCNVLDLNKKLSLVAKRSSLFLNGEVAKTSHSTFSNEPLLKPTTISDWPDGYIIFQSLAVYIIENLPIGINIVKVGTQVCQIPNQNHSINCPKPVIILAKFRRIWSHCSR